VEAPPVHVYDKVQESVPEVDENPRNRTKYGEQGPSLNTRLITTLGYIDSNQCHLLRRPEGNLSAFCFCYSTYPPQVSAPITHVLAECGDATIIKPHHQQYLAQRYGPFPIEGRGVGHPACSKALSYITNESTLSLDFVGN
jgi:hypothetical protein